MEKEKYIRKELVDISIEMILKTIEACDNNFVTRQQTLNELKNTIDFVQTKILSRTKDFI